MTTIKVTVSYFYAHRVWIYARIYVCGLDFRDNILTNQKEKILSTLMA